MNGPEVTASITDLDNSDLPAPETDAGLKQKKTSYSVPISNH